MPVVEWLYSERPWICFQQFISDNAPENAEQIQLLKLWGKKQRFHFDKSLGLKTTAQLSLIMDAPWNADKSPALMRYFANKPGTLEVRAGNAMTPALSSVAKDCLDAAKLLLELGADFTRRDALGNNVLHLLFHYVSGKDSAATVARWIRRSPLPSENPSSTPPLLSRMKLNFSMLRFSMF